ncbi:MAG: hypothetical protein D6710_01375 [Nitrospirae bacterium]|nr:MAG: hypothetical protein D6710_01375 [Nitrospirota bacterium]
MGEKIIYQPLTTWDKVSVVLYRGGIVIFSLVIFLLGLLSTIKWKGVGWSSVLEHTDLRFLNSVLYLLYVTVGISVFTIHLYLKRFRRFIRGLYALSIASLIVMIFLRGADLASFLLTIPVAGLLWLPLAGCISFITMKEAFCFRFIEGYILTMLLPLFVLVFSSRMLQPSQTGTFLLLIGLLMLVFTFRKTIMPLAFDIGDKTAYET